MLLGPCFTSTFTPFFGSGELREELRAIFVEDAYARAHTHGLKSRAGETIASCTQTPDQVASSSTQVMDRARSARLGDGTRAWTRSEGPVRTWMFV